MGTMNIQYALNGLAGRFGIFFESICVQRASLGDAKTELDHNGRCC